MIELQSRFLQISQVKNYFTWLELIDELVDSIKAFTNYDEWGNIENNDGNCLSDYIIASYWVLSHWHNGGKEYDIFCNLGLIYQPGPSSDYNSESDSVRMIYNDLDQIAKNTLFVP